MSAREDLFRRAKIADLVQELITSGPRRVTTWQELEALPARSVVVDTAGNAWVSAVDGWWSGRPTRDQWRQRASSFFVADQGPLDLVWSPSVETHGGTS